MNTWVATLTRMLGGAVAGSMMLVGGVAEAGAARIHLETVDVSGNVEAVAGPTHAEAGAGTCLIASPTDGFQGEGKRPCILMNVIVNHVLGVVAGDPADLMASPTDALTASSSGQEASLLASPTDGKQLPIGNKYVIEDLMASPTDGLMASPTDGRGQLSLMASPTDGLAPVWVVVSAGQNGRFSAIVDLARPAPAQLQLDARTTLATEAALALVDLGVQPDDIDLDAVSMAVSGVAFTADARARVPSAADLAVDQLENGSCTGNNALAAALCNAIR